LSARQTDVVLVCMPFGPIFSPSIALSLLKAALSPGEVSCEILYFSIPFAERVGEKFYSGIAAEERPSPRELAGEWIFSAGLADALPDDDAYVDEVLARPIGSGRRRTLSRTLVRRIREARRAVPEFLEACTDVVVARRPLLVGFTSVFQQHAASLGLARRLK